MKFPLACLLLLFPLLSYSQLNTTVSTADRLANLESRADEASTQIRSIESDVAALKDAASLLMRQHPFQIYLTPSTEDFAVLNPGVGQIVVFFKNLKSHASGTEFSLGVVNTASVPLTNVEFDAEVFPTDGSPIQRAKMLSKQKGITLPVGKEFKASFRVPEIKPDLFKEVRVRAFVGGITYKAGK